MRLDPESWPGSRRGARRQDPVPSRAEAVRILVEDGLERAGQPVLRDGDKLIVAMLCDLFRSGRTSAPNSIPTSSWRR